MIPKINMLQNVSPAMYITINNTFCENNIKHGENTVVYSVRDTIQGDGSLWPIFQACHLQRQLSNAL